MIRGVWVAQSLVLLADHNDSLVSQHVLVKLLYTSGVLVIFLRQGSYTRTAS